MKYKYKKILSDLWMKDYMNNGEDHCPLCSHGVVGQNNTGFILSPFNGKKYFCICPNGRSLKENLRKRNAKTNK
jgi:hypothetical protein